MNLHEYQAKQLFAEYGLPVSKGAVGDTPDEVVEACGKVGGSLWVVKVQAHTGGRGKAGGVKLVKTPEEAKAFAEQWLGQKIVTHQTGPHGQPVSKMLVEQGVDIDRELYLGAVIDRSSRRVMFMATTEGGMDIEKVAAETPEKIFKVAIDPLVGPQPFQGRALAFDLGLSGDQIKVFTKIFIGLARMILDYDLALVEINPLVVTKDGTLNCLDAKINVDNNALFRQPRMKEFFDPTQEDKREADAAKWELNYVALDGNIGCLVNGAGLAMGTMDIIKLEGGAPANFLDVGGGATKERVAEAFKLVLSDDKVKAVLVNIFGGIVRCDMIAEGVLAAIKEVQVKVPVVVRLEGNHAKAGGEILANSGLNILYANSLKDAAKQAVKAVEGQA